MEEEARIDLVISGVSTAPGGIYKNVNIQGVSKVDGDVECVDCTIEGVATIFGGVQGKKIHVKGKAEVQGDILGDVVNLEGQIKIRGKCDAEKFISTGAVTVSGLLNAGDVRIQLYGPSRVREIGAETIRVEKEPGRSIFGRLKTLSVETIEGDEIYLENTKAKVVRGNRVVIGAGCHIELVEYGAQFEQHQRARVETHKRL